MSTMYHLSKHRVLTIKGPDAKTFLQGQTTNDIEALEPFQVHASAHCNHKGRMISSFMLGCFDAESYTLRVHQSLAESASAALQKYMVFSKATLEISPLEVFTLEHASKEDIGQLEALSGAVVSVDPISNFVELYLPKQDVATFIASHPDTPLCAQAWEKRMIERGIAEVRAETSEKFLPQELNYDVIGGVNFKKGCYTGQEIIARLHYRGQAKKRLRRGSVTSEHTAANGDAVVAFATGKTKGEVLFVQNTGDDQHEFLATIANDALETDCALESNLTAKIEWLPLPYAIP